LKDVELDADFREEVKALSKAERGSIGQAIADIQEAFRNPHVHSGIGIRKLKSTLYEARIDLGQRLLFENRKDCLFFFMLGSHDAIQKYLQSL
jgi:mRNA-degrading endonuclease RelE of RelBE toxin-antitoxin system